MARPKKEIEMTPEKYVEDLAAHQCSKTEIASLLGISVDTFDRRYAAIYSKGIQSGRAKLRQKLYQTALAGNVVAMIFCSKNWLGMSDRNSVEVSGPNGGPVEVTDARQRLVSKLAVLSSRERTA